MSLFIFYLDVYEILRIIGDLKTNSVPGYDGISNTVIKLTKEFLVYLVTHLCKLNLEQGVFPDVFNTAIVSPIFKSDDKHDVFNYRLISLFSSISKILEQLVNNSLIKFLEKNNLVTDFQYGFRRGRSTDDEVLKLTTLIHGYTDVGAKLFLDLKKAFDTVSIPILLAKLESLGIRGHAQQWFRSYLEGRKQHVRVNNYFSDAETYIFGIPQGSNLGPTLFLTYLM